MVILYSAVEIPFSSSFLWAPPYALQVLDILIDSLLLCDVLICFVTGYVDADDKKTMRLIVAAAVLDTLEALDMSYPGVTAERAAELRTYRERLLND